MSRKRIWSRWCSSLPSSIVRVRAKLVGEPSPLPAPGSGEQRRGESCTECTTLQRLQRSLELSLTAAASAAAALRHRHSVCGSETSLHRVAPPSEKEDRAAKRPEQRQKWKMASGLAKGKRTLRHRREGTERYWEGTLVKMWVKISSSSSLGN